MDDLFNTEGEFASYLTFDNTSKRFTLKNHQLTTYQKLIFNCEKVMVADKYLSITLDENGVDAATVPAGYEDGDAVLLYDDQEEIYYYVYVKTVGMTKKFASINFDYPVSFSDVLAKANPS